MLVLHKTMSNLKVFCFPPDAMSEERQLYRLNVWCTVRVESYLRTSKTYFIGVLRFPLFGKISWRKKWLSSVKLKTKSKELECVIFILSFNLRHHSFYTGYTTICEDFYPLKKNPTLPVHHMYVLLDLQYMIAADIILSRVMIKPDYAEKNNDTDQPTYLHSLF